MGIIYKDYLYLQVHTNGRVIWVATQHVAATSLDTADTAAFTRGLATASQAGTHPHITGLVSIYLQYLHVYNIYTGDCRWVCARRLSW